MFALLEFKLVGLLLRRNKDMNLLCAVLAVFACNQVLVSSLPSDCRTVCM